MRSVVLCRLGELFLKGANRSRFEQQLAEGLRRAVAGLPGARVATPHGRMLIEVAEPELEEAARRAARVFGLVSVSPAAAVAPEPAAIETAAVALARAAIARDPARARGFKIAARRSDKSLPFSSRDLAVRVGAAVAAATGAPVRMDDPPLIVGIDVTRAEALVFTDVLSAPGGLPVGSSGHALLLLSGGIDSPVAGWLAAKRGLALDAIYFHSPPFVGERSKDKVVTLARALASWGALRALHVVHFTQAQQRLREAGPAELAVVLYRRMMMRTADAIADRIGAEALITGENLGQVASQTVRNLTAIEAATRRLVLRPLLTYDKTETTALARAIGTYDTSALPYDDCCSLFVPAHPATGARVEDAARAETKLDVEATARELAAAAEAIVLAPRPARETTRDADAGDPAA